MKGSRRAMDIYDTMIAAIREYFKDEDYETLFLHGGCFWFASLVADWVPNSYIMINRNKEHCAVVVEQKLCDITGPISKSGYEYAEEKELNYMKKHYICQQNLNALKAYINERIVHMLQYKEQHRAEMLNCKN